MPEVTEKATPLGACRASCPHVREPGSGFSTALRQLRLRCPDSGIHAVAMPIPVARPVDLDSPPHRGPGQRRAIGQPLLRCLNSGIQALAMARTRYARCAGGARFIITFPWRSVLCLQSDEVSQYLSARHRIVEWDGAIEKAA
jgi:hypothetical protein